MDPVALIELKMALEFGIAPVENTLPLAIHEQDDQPLVLVSHVADAFHMYVREDVSPAMRQQLLRLGAPTCYRAEEAVRAVFADAVSWQQVRRIRWYVGERWPDRSEYPDVSNAAGRFFIVRDGREVAWAETDWENKQAAEVSIETLAAYRRRGFARQVTAAWMATQMEAGRIGFYSHRLTNEASQAVAQSLGLRHLSDEVEYI